MSLCIYCNSPDVNISDIIPYALTNSKIRKKNVCTDRHNNVFGRTFEHDVIKELSVLRDKLDIDNRENKYPEYDTELEINDSKFLKKGNSGTQFYNGILSSKDKKTKLGPLETIRKIADSEIKKGKQIEKIDVIDLNTTLVEYKHNLSLNAFFSRSSKRLIAKMAYEWFCYKYNIEKFNDDFSKIVNYICEDDWSNEEDLVSFIKDEHLYNLFEANTMHGSHTLLAYENESGTVNVLVSFFGICLYNVKILDAPTANYNENCFLQEFQITSKKVNLNKQNIKTFNEFLKNAFEQRFVPELGRVVYYPKDEVRDTVNWKAVMLYESIMKIIDTVILQKDFDEELTELVKNNYEKIMNEYIVHLRSLKRFVKNHLANDEDIEFNPHGTNVENIIKYYIVYKVGKSEIAEIDDSSFYNILSEDIYSNDEIIVNEEYGKKIWDEVLSDTKHQEILKIGAKKIMDAKLD